MLLINSYYRLLADIRSFEGGSLLSIPDNITMDWVLIEAPKLDKIMLVYIEDNTAPLPSFPEWLEPLWKSFLDASHDDSRQGVILRYIRQVLTFCYKAEYAPTNDQQKAAQAAFIETDRDCGNWSEHFSKNACSDPLFRTARQTVGRVIYRIDWTNIKPAHGPGAVFPPCAPLYRSKLDTMFSSIDKYYPLADYFCPLPSYWDEVFVKGDGDINVKTSIKAKLVSVPKDSRGPRLICVHPKEAIWIQQGQRKLLEKAITDNPITRGRINFDDQRVNGSLALASSKDRRFATLDLKEASDRIACSLVRYLFGGAYDIMSCARADTVQLLCGRDLELKKWAPMGNCLTFPVQSLIFFSLVRSSILLHHGVTCDEIYVFGDDIVFPSIYYEAAIVGLVKAGLVPNQNKTFYRGFFRESCGVDAYKGVDVTPHRIRKQSVVSYSDMESICALAKAMRIDGYVLTSAYLYAQVRNRFGRLPCGNNPDGQGLYEYVDYTARYLRMCASTTVKWNKHLHIWMSRTYLVTSTLEGGYQDGWYHLLDSLSRCGTSERALEYTVPYSSRLSSGWNQII